MERVASIDIGTNTILLLVAELKEGKLNPLLEMETIVRLGKGVQKNRVLSEEAMERGLQTLAHYLEKCRVMGAQKIFAVGTSALREGRNAEIFLKMSEEKLNLPIEIISGEEEAKLSYLAVVTDLRETKEPILVVDIGGGSTEFILGRNGEILHWVSLALGGVRITEEFLQSDPVQEEEWAKMERKIQTLLAGIPQVQEPFSMVAVGGTATTLASVALGLEEFVVERIHHFVLRKEALGNQLSLFRSKTLKQRGRIPGLLPARADVILAGGAILYLAMEKLYCPSVLISCHGLRYGLLYKKLHQSK